MTQPREIAIRPDATWESVRSSLGSWAREVRAVLAGGWRLRDQTRVVLDVVIDTAALPVDIDTPAAVMPLGVVLVRAVQQLGTTAHVISGGAVTWQRVGGGIRIVDIDGLAATTRYDVTLAVVE